jgi:hypothetical protein
VDGAIKRNTAQHFSNFYRHMCALKVKRILEQ